MTDQKYMRPGLDFATGKLVEELGELLAALGKTMRWGRDSFNPELPPAAQEPNWHWIEREIDDVLGAIANYRKEAGTATPARTDDAAQAGGSVTQSDADAANAWMRDHLDGGNAPGSLCIAFAQHRERHAQAGGGVAAMREAAAKVAEDELVEIFEDSPETDTVCNEIVRHIAKAIRALPLPTQEVEPAAEGEQTCKSCNGFGYARGGICWNCNGVGKEPVDAQGRDRDTRTDGAGRVADGPVLGDGRNAAPLADIVAWLEAIRDVVREAYFAADDSEDRSCEDPPIHCVPHSNFIDLCNALDAAEAFAREGELWNGPGPLVTRIIDILSTQAAYPTGAGEGERLRIGWWNDMKARGVSDDAAILTIQATLAPADARKGEG